MTEREEFEKWYSLTHWPSIFGSGTDALWQAWQAARAHRPAPEKFDPKRAYEIAIDVMYVIHQQNSALKLCVSHYQWHRGDKSICGETVLDAIEAAEALIKSWRENGTQS